MESIMERHQGRVTLAVRSEYDDSPDTSWLGENVSYRNVEWHPTAAFYSYERDAIRLPKSDVWRDRKGRIVAEPESLDPWNTRYHRDVEFLKLDTGNYAGETSGVLGYLFQDADRLRAYYNNDWTFVGIVATVKVDGKELGNASVWGFESDSGDDYIRSEARNIATEALAEAKAFIASLA